MGLFRVALLSIALALVLARVTDAEGPIAADNAAPAAGSDGAAAGTDVGASAMKVGQKSADEETQKSTEELQTLSSAQLANLEQETLRKVHESEQELAGLRSETAVLKRQQQNIQMQADKKQGALEWEASEKKKRDDELTQAKRDVEEKHESITRMSKRVAELKEQIQELQAHMKNLTAEREKTTRRMQKPSLSDVIDARAQGWSPVSQHVYRKTRAYVGSGVSGVSTYTAAYRRRVSSSPALDLVASLLLYGFFVLGAISVHKIYTKVRGHLTVARLLFLGDSFCAGFWAVMLLCYCFLWMDPLIAVQARSPTLFFFFQLAALICYVNFVLLRVLLLASKLTLSALGETLSVVVVGHHYYVRVWQPAMLDQPIHGTFFYYFCYAWLFLAFAYNRVNEFAPLKQLRGPKLPPLMALKVLFSRFTAKGVPDGDLESRPFVDVESGDDDHQS